MAVDAKEKQIPSNPLATNTASKRSLDADVDDASRHRKARKLTREENLAIAQLDAETDSIRKEFQRFRNQKAGKEAKENLISNGTVYAFEQKKTTARLFMSFQQLLATRC